MIFPFSPLRPHFRRPAPLVAVLVVGLTILSGCRDEESIQVYDVPRIPDRGIRVASPGEPARLVGAVLNAGDRTWFFKVSGPERFVTPYVDAVRKFVASVRFEGAEPKFEVPAGWRDQGAGPMRYKTYAIDFMTQPHVELAVTSLPAGQNLAENVRRWRRQLKLSEPADEEALRDVEDLPTAAGLAKWVDLKGTYSPDTSPPFAGGMAGGDMAGGMPDRPAEGAPAPLPAGHPPLPEVREGPAPVMSRTAPTGSPVKYEAPAEWTPVAPSQFSLVAFEVDDGPKSVRITISNAAGDLLSNVNRWRQQELNLPPIDESKLETAVTKMKIGDQQGDYLELLGPAGERQLATLVGMVPGKEGTWFVKMKGDASLVQLQRANFSRFLSTLRFER